MNTVADTQQINALLRDDSLLDTDQFVGASSLTSQDDDIISKDDSISVATSGYTDATSFEDMYTTDNKDKSKKNLNRNNSKQFKKGIVPSKAALSGQNHNHGHGRQLNKKDSIFSDESFATTVYTEETVELRDGEKVRQMQKKNGKRMKHQKTDSSGSLFQKKSIHTNILPAQQLNTKNINNPMSNNNNMNNNINNNNNNINTNASSKMQSSDMTKSGLSSQLKNYYGGSPLFGAAQTHKIRESIDMDAENDNSNEHDSGARHSFTQGSVPLERESVIVSKSVLTLRQRTQFPQKQIRVKMYLPHEPEDEEPQQIILFINPGAQMGFVKQFLEDSYPHRYLQGRIKQLCIADEDGDIDDDFPPIDPNQDITRLGVMNFYIDVSFQGKYAPKNNGLKSIDSSIEVDKFSNTLKDMPDLPMSFESFDNNGMNNNNNNNDNNDIGTNYINNDPNKLIATARRLSDAARQLNEHRRSLSQEDKNYFETEEKRKSSWCCCCCCGSSNNNSSSSNRVNPKSPTRMYSYRVDKDQIYRDAGSYQPPKPNNHNINNNGYNRLHDEIEMGDGARGIYENKVGRGASVMSSDTTASNRQFSKV